MPQLLRITPQHCQATERRSPADATVGDVCGLPGAGGGAGGVGAGAGGGVAGECGGMKAASRPNVGRSCDRPNARNADRVG